jgi:hypothetical protein
MTMQEQQGANISESIPEQKKFGYSLGGYSHRERWPRTLTKLQIIRVMKQTLKYIVEYLVKRRTSDTNYSFSHSHRVGVLDIGVS